jgi:anhydro-N-acetylmuramic acid kinase
MAETKYNVVGLMSGTSLDGLDLCLCSFTFNPTGKWKYSVTKAETTPYDRFWQQALMHASSLTGSELIRLDRQYGAWLGEQVKQFLSGLPAHFVASHGHTVFHMPSKGITFQLGAGAALHAVCGLAVVCDFRSIDVAFGGEGAPLVPAGERILFSEFELLLNLGGIANITFQSPGGNIFAHDVAFANMAFNRLASLAGLPYDHNGNLTATGRVSKELYALFQETLGAISGAQSLGREQFEQHLEGLLLHPKYKLEDKLCTYAHYVVNAIESAVKTSSVMDGVEVLKPRMLVTGGGAENTYFMRLLKQKLDAHCHVVIPDVQTIRFKEAIVFAFLGLLRLMGKPNALQSATGASRDSIGGALYGSLKL